jgi:predicted outer membrane protein
MNSLRTSWVLVAFAGLIVATAAWAQQAGANRQNQLAPAGGGQAQPGADRQPGQPRQPGAAGQPGQPGAQGQDAVPADKAIADALRKIAEDPKTAADKVFVLTTVLDNQADIALARQIMEKSQNEQVKRLAQQRIEQLTKEDQQLRQVAQQLGLQIPQGIAAADAMEIEIVAALPADELDQAYTAHVQAENASDVSAYQSEAQIARDPQLKQLAQQQLRGQQMRSQQTDTMARGMGMPAGSGEAQPAGGRERGSGAGGAGGAGGGARDNR